ncbi:MAG: hypothetical protein O2816_04045 [Planctomycetota bacterium]|nr:hypothetical protein [Planctomycetota bacterium]
MADPEDRTIRAARETFAGEVLEVTEVLAGFERFAASSLGVRALRELVPLGEDGARAALERLTEMQMLLKAKDLPSMAGVCDPLPAKAGAARRLDEDQLVALRSFLDAAKRLKAWLAERVEDVPRLGEIGGRIPDLSALVAEIDTVLDERGRVKRDASDLLQRLRQRIGDLSSQIDERVRRVLARSDVRNVLSDSSVHRRGGRPVLAVRAKSSGHVKGIVHDRSSSGESVFVEPQEVIELGNLMAEAHADERREVERILLELSTLVRNQRERIERSSTGVAQLELAWISTHYCAEVGARPALLPGERMAATGLLLRAARHPLLIEQVRVGQIDAVVPIDLRLGGDFSMLIITGPNTGGKTVALKTAGLFALLTRMGLPVPAEEGTTVPLYDRVCADIGDEQEIRQNLSTFASHLARIKDALERADERSLVLLDELGGGTDPEEGAALGEAVLEDFVRRKVPTLCSTHMGKLKEFAFRHAAVENACTEFDVETLAPTYRLTVGTPGESGAIVIARRLGIPQRITDRASARRERRDGEVAEVMEDLRKARLGAERLRADAEERVAQAAEHARGLEDKAGELERRGEQLEAEAQKGIEERVRDGLRLVEKALALLSQVPKEAAGPMRGVLETLQRELTGATLTERRQGFLDSMRKGSLVFLPRYRQRMIVHRVDRDKREVTCKLGSMKVRVSFEEVTPYEQL